MQWPGSGNDQSDGSSVTFQNWASSGVDMTMTIFDPANRNGDADNDLLKHADPGGSEPIPNWDPMPTQPATRTDGVFGAGFLTVFMNSLFVGESVTFRFEFSSPVTIPDFSAGDIDYSGLGAPNNGEPHDSFQDEVELAASRGGVDVPVTINPQGSGGSRPVASGQAVRGGPYNEGVNGDLMPDDANGTVVMSVAEPVDFFQFVYSNGPDDEAAEANDGGAFDPQPPLPANADSVSNSHAIRINFSTVCVGAGSIGDRVWNDLNGDGVQDAGEPGIEGVVLELVDPDGNVSATTTTGPDGSYQFPNLPAFDWTVRVDPASVPPGFELSGDPDGTLDSETTVMLGPGEAIPTVDFGFSPPASIAGTVYEDLNNDGVVDPGEPGIEGVTVTLTGTDDLGNPVEQTTLTGPDGSYLFAELRPGTYEVSEAQPGGFLDGKDTPGSEGGDASVNDVISSVALPLGADAISYDFGELPPSSIAGVVFVDADNDGIEDGLEPGIEGVTVTLTGTDDLGNPVEQTTLTGPDGSYLFAELRPGTYEVSEAQPGGFLDGKDTPGSEGGDASVNDVISSVALPPGIDAISYDFGELVPSSIAGTVYEDLNNDGVVDPGEPGIEGVTVTLTGTDDLGNPVEQTTLTGPDGSYLFAELRPGTYEVSEAQPGGFLDGKDTPGSEGGDASVNDVISSVALPPGADAISYDFGEFLPVSLGDFAWKDENGNGIQDEGERGVSVTVELQDCDDGTVLDTTMTGADGGFLFDGLAPSTFCLKFIPPAGAELTTKDAGTDDTIDSDPDPQTGLTDPITLISGQTDLSVDAGIFIPVSLGDFVWEDLDGDGVQDPGEPGVANATVELQDCDDGTVLDTMTTDAAGGFLFDGLTPSTFCLKFIPPAGAELTTKDAGTDDAVDSDPNPQTGLTDPITLISGQTDLSVDAGIFIPVSLGDFVWEDLDGDGVQDPGEPGVEGVSVNLVDCDGGTVLDTTTTGAGGGFLFDGLVPQTYCLEVVPPEGAKLTTKDAGTDDAIDSDPDPATGLTDPITLSSGVDELTADTGIFFPVALGDFVWEDVNGNGLQDPDEPGVEGVEVSLVDCDDGTVLATETTGADGGFLFDGLVAGTFCLKVVPPEGAKLTTKDAGTDDAIDSDPDPATGITDPITLPAGEGDLTVDAGIFFPVSLGDRVWEDLNDNGVQDPGEPGVEGVSVNLVDCDDGTVLTTETTGAGGEFLFAGLAPGTYCLEVVPPEGAELTTKDAGADDALDSDADPGTGRMDPITLSSGQTDLSLDAGIFFPVSLGDRVWEDLNGNGVQDPDEPGVEGVTVNLVDCDDGTVLDTRTTGADGGFLFAGLVPGAYCLEVVPPDGAELTTKDAGTDDTVDSDPDPATGLTDPIALSSGVDELTADAGIFFPVSLGDFVWEDLDGDGVQDDGEPGIEGVSVKFLAGDCNTELGPTTTTDAAGKFLFGGLAPGTFCLEFDPSTLPDGASFTTQNAPGSTQGNDSDADATGKTAPIPLISGQTDLTRDAGIIVPAPAPAAITELDLTITKELPKGPFGVGDKVEITLRVVNLGGVAAPDVVVTDPLPAGLRLVSVSASQGTCERTIVGRRPAIVCRLGTLEPGQSVTITEVVRIKRQGSFKSTASVTSSGEEVDTTNNTAVGALRAGFLARLKIRELVSESKVKPGEALTYKVKLRSVGNQAARKVLVCLRIPSVTTFVKAPGARFVRGRACWRLGRLKSGAKRAYEAKVQVSRTARPGRKRSAAKASAQNARQVRASRGTKVLPAPTPRPVPPVTG